MELSGLIKFLKEKAVIIIYIFILLSVSFILLSDNLTKVAYHGDEISWFFHTRHFEKNFLKKDYNKYFWESYSAYDHPQLSKYIYGASLYIRNNNIFSKRDELEKKYHRWFFYKTVGETGIENSDFPILLDEMRKINLLFSFGTLVIIFFIVMNLTGSIIISSLTPFAFINNSVFVNTVIPATNDAQALFFITASILIFQIYLKRKNQILFILFALFSAMAISTKLTGMVIIISYLVFEAVILVGKMTFKNIKNILIRISLFVIIVFSFWWISNPTIQHAPIKNSIEYFSFQKEVTERQQSLLEPDVINNFNKRLKAVYCTLISPKCDSGFYEGYLFPWATLNILLILSGAYFVIEKIKNNDKKQIFLFTGTFILLVLSIVGSFLPMNWIRYYLLLVVVLYLLQFMGLKKIIIFVKKV